jgi:hypothetical protein
MWLTSSAVAVTFAAVSPGNSDRFVAKSVIRVRVSGLNGAGAVTGKGSASSAVDSTAIARVEFVFVSNTGGLASLARAGASNAMQQKKKTKMK